MRPEFSKEYEKATSFKLRPSFEMYDDPIETWLNAKDCIVQTLVYFLSRTHNLGERMDKESPEILHLNSFPESYLRQGNVDLLGFFIYNWNATKHLKSIRNFFNPRKPFSKTVHVSMYYLALSIKERGEIDESMLEKSISIIASLVPVKQKMMQEANLFKKWKMTRNYIITGWRIARL